MQHDTIIWSVIKPGGGGFCSFRRRLPNNPAKFCKNPYNVLGLCHPGACPLANSRYATVREHKGDCYLYMKTIERAHTPAKLWEKVKLSKDYMKALKQIDEHLIWWPQWMIHKCKLRLTKIHQYLIRSRKLAMTLEPKLVRIWKPYERQQQVREEKAEIAAKITNVIKQELMDRLKDGVYEGIYNFPSKQYNEILEEQGMADEEDNEQMDSDIDIDLNEQQTKPSKSKQKQQQQEEKEDNIPEFIADFDVSENEEEIEDIGNTMPQKNYELELEFESANRMAITNSNSNNNSNNIGNSGSTYGKSKSKPLSKNEKKRETNNLSKKNDSKKIKEQDINEDEDEDAIIENNEEEDVMTDENEIRASLLNMMQQFDNQPMEDMEDEEENYDGEYEDEDEDMNDFKKPSKNSQSNKSEKTGKKKTWQKNQRKEKTDKSSSKKKAKVQIGYE